MQPLRKVLKFELPDDRQPMDWSQESQTVGQAPDWIEAACTTCQGTGYVQVFDPNKLPGETGWQRMVACSDPDCPIVKQHRDSRYEALVSRAPLPPEYREYNFDSWYALAQNSPGAVKGKWLAYGAALAFVRAAPSQHWFQLQEAYDVVGIEAQAPNPYTKNSVILSGPPGVGKTSLAACVVNALRTDKIPALYIRVSNLLDALKEPMNRGDGDYMYEFGRTEQQILDTFSKAPVLVLDEFNLARVSDYSSQRLEDIIRYRMANQLPSVMTTNLRNFDDFNEHWGYRVGHAVQGMAHWIVMGGIELRRRGGPVESV